MHAIQKSSLEDSDISLETTRGGDSLYASKQFFDLEAHRSMSPNKILRPSELNFTFLL
jgi:hypothetical protein